MVAATALLLTIAALRPSSHKMIVGYVMDGNDTPDVVSQVAFDEITHLNVAFINPSNADGDLMVTPHLDQLVEAAHKQHVKILMSLGGGAVSEDDGNRSNYFALIGPSKLAGFVAKLTQCVKDHNLDGIDVDLEGPAINADYGAFVSALSQALKPQGKLLTAAVSGGNGGDHVTGDTLACYDFINVMAYDATGPWNPSKAGPHASMDFAMEATGYWLGRGVPKSKLVLGVPFYGWGFGDSFTPGGYSFSQLVEKYPGSELTDQTANTIYYNGIPTIRAKAQYVLDQDLAGVMIWSLGQDAKGKLSLLAALHDVLSGK